MSPMSQNDRYNRQRRISEDCSQCGIHENQISVLKEDMSRHLQESGNAITTLHRRVDKSLPWKVFLLVMAAYLGLAGYNAVAIKALSIDLAKVQTQTELVVRKLDRTDKFNGR